MFDLQNYIIVFTIIAIIFLRAILGKRRNKLRLPPSPPSIPIIGHLHLLSHLPHQNCAKLSNRYGPLIHLYMGSIPCLLVSSQEMVKEVYKNNENSFLDRPTKVNLDYLTFDRSDMGVAPYGPFWKFMKKLCMNELLGTRTLDRLLPVRREEMIRFVKIIKEKAEAGEAIDIAVELKKLGNNVISRMLLGKRCSDKEDEANEVLTILKELNRLGTMFNLSDLFWFCKYLDLQGFRKRIKDVRDKYDILMEKTILEHKEARKNGADRVNDVVDILINISEDENAEMKLTRNNIKAFVMDFFGAGTETSSSSIGWGLAELIIQPKVMEKAQKEIDSVVGRDRILEESDIENLPYLQAITKEILRLHPAAPLIVRESIQDCVVAGYDIPRGTRLFVNAWALARDPKQWDRPLDFIPERFLGEEWRQGKNPFMDLRGQNLSLLPFGSGRRSCPGASLALRVVPTVLGMAIQCFDWKLDGENATVNMEEELGNSLQRAHPLFCRPVPRLSPFPSL